MANLSYFSRGGSRKGEDIEKEINIQAQLFLHCKHYNGLVNNNMGYQ